MLTLKTLTEICKRLNQAGVEYGIIGGFAIFLHGYERTTKDIDLLIDPSETNINKLKGALKDVLPEACHELTTDDVINNVVVRMSGENLVVDLMAKVGDITYANAKFVPETIEEVIIPVADLDTMIELKKGVRDRDQRDYLFLRGKKEFLERQK
ncbi:MAG: nucleotidyltransferase [Deltaproteobacteria bacterium]|nr:nucleotidyltransferase [Deltaproteobacteria bacterium]